VKLFLLSSIPVFLCLAGCTVIRQDVITTLEHPDGTIERRELHAKGRAFGDTHQSLSSLRISNGKTQSVGLSGMDQETSATNAVDLIEKIVGAAVRAAIQP
jgi:hypothetical protein